jgi:hypothetical protein
MDLEVKCSASHLKSAVPFPYWNTCFMIKLARILLFVSQRADNGNVAELI